MRSGLRLSGHYLEHYLRVWLDWLAFPLAENLHERDIREEAADQFLGTFLVLVRCQSHLDPGSGEGCQHLRNAGIRPREVTHMFTVIGQEI